MSATLPLVMTRPPKRRKAYARLEQHHRVVTDLQKHRGGGARSRHTPRSAVSQNWALLRYAQDFDRNLKKAGLRPDAHWHDSRADFAPPPPNPTATAAAPKAKGPAAKSSPGQALKAAAEKLCGLLDDFGPLVPVYRSTDPNMCFSPDESRKYWQCQY